MIYTKKANFPYPILMNFSDDYQNSEFELDVALRDNSDQYIIDVSWNISSDYIKNQLKHKKATLILIIKSKDNQYYPIDCLEKPQINIPKCKLGLNSRTVMQLMIKTNSILDFKDNNDLNSFFNDIKQDIHIQSGMVLGFSNIVIFDGSQQKPYELFERKVDKSITSDVEIRLSEETIVIVYKNERLQFSDINNSKEFNYPYLYLGLQKALIRFLIHTNQEKMEETVNIEEAINIDEIDPPENVLDSKLYNLMQAKNITVLHFDNIDEVIYKMTDKLITRYADAIRGLNNEN